MTYTKLLFDKKDGIGFITLNDPDNGNPTTVTLCEEFSQCLDECAADPSVRAVVLKAAGKNFSVGGNVKEFKGQFEAGIVYDYDSALRQWGAVMKKIRTLPKPVIASMHGAVAGGGLSLVLSCDFRIATEDAKLTFAFVNIGLAPDDGSGFVIQKMLGVAKATELMMTGKLFSGKEACAWGIVNEAVPMGQLEEATLKLANKFAKGPTLAYGAVKKMVWEVSFKGFEDYVNMEAKLQQELGQSADHKEAVYAFVEKRKPAFTGQ